MTSPLERISRLASPATLFLALLAFALPFCALSCNASFVGAGTADVAQASGLNLVVGGDVTPDCASLQKLAAAVSRSFGGTGSASSSATVSGSSDCAGSSSTSTSTTPAAGSGATPSLSNLNQTLGPFGPSGNAGKIHVSAQPLALMAVILLVLGIALTALAGRIRSMVSAAVALGAVASLIALRILTSSNFSTDVTNQAAQQGSSPSSLGLNINPSDVLLLNWGLGWLVAVILAGVAVVVNAVALLPIGAGATEDQVPAPYVPTQSQQAWGPSPAPPPPTPAEPWGAAATPPPPPAAAPPPQQPLAESGRTQSFMPQRPSPPAEPAYGFGPPAAPPPAPQQQPWEQAPPPAPSPPPQPQPPWEQQPQPPRYPPQQ